MIQFADDTVLCYTSKAVETIETKLNEDLNCVSKYFSENELIMNVNKSKTESMLFGTKERPGKVSKSLNLVYNGAQISSTTEYKFILASYWNSH